ncbi:hypothetical protein H3222_22380 [Pseudomonas chengduensis]|jgi:hypothetical protein|nr:hypothetical protein [Pseudomonas chengduensis]MBG0847948.1 hypothetical protein [Pseudomonas chengduensis]
MSAKIIPFPMPASSRPDPIDLLAERLASTMADLPPADDAGEQLKLLRRIDRKLAQLVKAVRQGGGQ